MSSIRRPKRLIIRGDDERDHPVLVKSGEDLRQDQRIEQLFAVMNILLANDAACAQRGLQLRIYQVIPITSRFRVCQQSFCPNVILKQAAATLTNSVYSLKRVIFSLPFRCFKTGSQFLRGTCICVHTILKSLTRTEGLFAVWFFRCLSN